jgi:hypothetical protein
MASPIGQAKTKTRAARHDQPKVDFLVGISNGRERVRREGRQGADLIQFLFTELLGGKGRANEEIF